MKKFVISMLFADSFAQEGYECVNPSSFDAWDQGTLTGDAPIDAATCKAACLTIIDNDEPTKVANDWCCAFGDNLGLITCALLYSGASDDDIRAEATPVDGITFEAWAWAAGVEIEEEEVVEDDAEDEEDDEEDGEDNMSVRMTLSALATASIAMLAM